MSHPDPVRLEVFRSLLAAVMVGRLMGLALLCACTYSAYQPALLRIPGGFPVDCFDRAVVLLQQTWQPLEVVDRGGFRIQSGWLLHDSLGTPGQKRATVFLEDPVTMAVVVEVRYLNMPAFGAPQWTSVRGDPALEQQLLGALREAMGGA